jgi:hypothetical protein
MKKEKLDKDQAQKEVSKKVKVEIGRKFFLNI